MTFMPKPEVIQDRSDDIDLPNAQALFRRAFTRGAWGAGHLRHIVPSLMPGSLFSSLVRMVDRRRQH